MTQNGKKQFCFLVNSASDFSRVLLYTIFNQIETEIEVQLPRVPHAEQVSQTVACAKGVAAEESQADGFLGKRRRSV